MPKTWKELKVGEIVRLEKNEMVPCDLLLLYADNSEGIAFVDTSMLDGETNLKEKLAPISGLSEQEVLKVEGRLYFDKPSAHLDDWNGELMGPSFDDHIFADVKNLLLRGTTLKNTNFAIGLSVNLGSQTKIMMNQKKPKSKISAMMRAMNYMLYSVFAF